MSAETFAGFLDSVRSESDARLVDPRKLADRLGIQTTALANMIAVHRNTLMMNPGSVKAHDGIRDVLRVLSAATSLNGSISAAVFWLKNQPIADFGHRTPRQLIQAGKTQSLVDYIESLDAGATG